MIDNPVIRTLMGRKSIRKYSEKEPSDEIVETVVRAGQQAPFAGQLYSFLLSRDRETIPFGAPLLFTICADAHRLELFMARRGWNVRASDLPLLLFAIQDACYAAENMVIAAESLGMGSCFLGDAPFKAEQIIARYDLPDRVFPVVQLAMGYPAETPPVRPRFPLPFTLFEDTYPDLYEKDVQEAMKAMDDGYLAQEYYRRIGFMVPLEGGREETFTFEDYSWTEHISRKYGQWFETPDELVEQLQKCGFAVTRPKGK